MEAWGRGGDMGFVAEDAAGLPIGAAWSRLFPAGAPGFGFVGDDIPELYVAGRSAHCRRRPSYDARDGALPRILNRVEGRGS